VTKGGGGGGQKPVLSEKGGDSINMFVLTAGNFFVNILSVILE